MPSIIVLLAISICACGGDDSAGFDAATSDDGGGATTFEAFLAGACSLGSSCTGMPEYSSCVHTQCAAAFRQCVGERYREQDFSGSPCAPYYECVKASGNWCANECVPDDACATCATETIAPCTMSSSCAQPVCDTERPQSEACARQCAGLDYPANISHPHPRS